MTGMIAMELQHTGATAEGPAAGGACRHAGTTCAEPRMDTVGAGRRTAAYYTVALLRIALSRLSHIVLARVAVGCRRLDRVRSTCWFQIVVRHIHSTIAALLVRRCSELYTTPPLPPTCLLNTAWQMQMPFYTRPCYCAQPGHHHCHAAILLRSLTT